MTPPRILLVGLLLPWMIVACGDDGPAADDTSGAPESTGTTHAAETTSDGESSETGAPSPTVQYSGCVDVSSLGDPGTGADDFEFSILDRPEIPSAFTNNAGCVVLAGLPPDEDLALSFAKDGFVPRIRPIHTGTSDFTNPIHEYVLGTEGRRLVAEWSGLPEVDPSLGQTRLYAVDATSPPDYLADIEVTSDAPLTAACYMPHDWFTASINSEGCASPGDNLGVLVAWNYEPVTLELTIARDGASCSPQVSDDGWALGWAVPGVPNAVRVPSRPGLETLSSVVCTP